MDDIVSIVSAGSDPGKLNKLYVRREDQWLGVGRRLGGRVARRFFDQGITTVSAYVDPGNANRRLFKALGGQWLLENERINVSGCVRSDSHVLVQKCPAAYSPRSSLVICAAEQPASSRWWRLNPGPCRGQKVPASRLTIIWFIHHNDDCMPTVVEGDFEWESTKAASNLAKHGVSFPEAATVFADPFAIYLDDGSGTGNMVVIGTSLRERVLYVAHVERDGRDRIISGRAATAGERNVYESGGNL